MGKELPKGWVEIELGNILTLKNGFAFKSSLYKDEGVPVIRISDIQQELVTTAKAICVNEEQKAENYRISKGDVLVAMSGATTGKYGVFQEDILAYQNQRVGNLIPNAPELTSRKFIFYLLGSLKKDIEDQAYGGAQPNISSKMIENLRCSIPPLPEQQRIVAKLDSLFAHIENTKKRLEKIPTLLKNFRQAVLSQAVTGKLTEEWREGKELESADVWRQRIIEERSQLGLAKRTAGLKYEVIKGVLEIPKNWTFGYLQNFGEFTRGKSKHRPRNDKQLYGGDYPFIQTGEVSRSGGLITKYKETYSDFGLAQSRLFPKGTLCITIAANIAETGILDFDSCFPDSIVGYLPYNDYLTAKYAMFCFMTMQKDIEHFAPATAQKNINLGILFEIPFPIPPKEEQTEIVFRVENLFTKADTIESKYKLLKEKIDNLPQTILSKAFKGELVAQLETDGDARELLKEIKKLSAKPTKKS